MNRTIKNYLDIKLSSGVTMGLRGMEEWLWKSLKFIIVICIQEE